MAQSTDKSQQCIRLPKEIASADTSFDMNSQLPSTENMPTEEEMEKIFIANLQSILADTDRQCQDTFERMLHAITGPNQ